MRVITQSNIIDILVKILITSQQWRALIAHPYSDFVGFAVPQTLYTFFQNLIGFWLLVIIYLIFDWLLSETLIGLDHLIFFFLTNTDVRVTFRFILILLWFFFVDIINIRLIKIVVFDVLLLWVLINLWGHFSANFVYNLDAHFLVLDRALWVF